MFLLLNAIVASLDGLIIGISLKLANIKITKMNILVIILNNIIIYSLFLYLYTFFRFTFITRNIATLLYLFLAWNAYHNQEERNYKNKLSFLKCLLLATTHSLDGALVSLNFVYKYTIFNIAFVFSIMSILLLLIGFHFANIFKNIKKGNIISSLLFILLAITNYLF